MTIASFGFAGLGAMGGPMAANLAAAGFPLTVYDKAGTKSRAPAGTAAVESVAQMAATAEAVFLSLPDSASSRQVTDAIAEAPGRRTRLVVDLSTVGIAAAQAIGENLGRAGIVYADAPVSGGQAGARAGTITVMWAGPGRAMAEVRPALNIIAAKVFRVGGRPGQGQAMKLANNFLSATAMAATAEALVFGEANGLDMGIMLEVINASTGRNSASSDKFPNRILTGTYDAGFRTTLMAKDMALYLDAVQTGGTASAIGAPVVEIWRRTDEALPNSDFTRIYDYVRVTSRA